MRKQEILILLVIGILISSIGCSKRITPEGFKAPSTIPGNVTILLPVDIRDQHYGETIDNSEWKSSKTVISIVRDTSKLLKFWEEDMPLFIQSRLIKQFNSSRLFSSAQLPLLKEENYVLKTEVLAYCSQKKGLFF
jgi:hypothetical protein